MKSLLITEKPSVAKEFAKVLGVTERHQGYIESETMVITWAIGHLITLKEPKEQNPEWEQYDLDYLPMFPTTMKYKVISSVADQYRVVKAQIQRPDIELIINAGDDGREGEYIQRLIYDMAGNQKPMKRLCYDSVSRATIERAMANMQDGHIYDGYYEAGKGRAWSDWLIGMNLSRLVGMTYNAKGVRIGRVQTPTLGMIGKRCSEIENFVSHPFYQVVATFQEGYSATWYNEEGNEIEQEATAQEIINKCQGSHGIIKSIKTTAKTINRPKLYSLNTLQADANKKYKYTTDKVLKIAQALYEEHKITTYPRTESEHITEDIKEELEERIKDIGTNPIAEKYSSITEAIIETGLNLDKNVVDDSKVSDHHAIIINENYATHNLSALSEEEKNILGLIITRMVLAVSQPCLYDETVVITEVEQEQFKATGKMIKKEGWKKYESILGGTSQSNVRATQEQEPVFPPIQANQTVQAKQLQEIKKKTSPPKYFTEGTLILAMQDIARVIDDKSLKEAIKKRGLGTTATRSSIIEGLIKAQYIKREKNKLKITEIGENILKVAPPALTTPHMSAEWEIQLQAIETGTSTLDAFMEEVKTYISQTVNEYKGKAPEASIILNKSAIKKVVGKCPYCGSDVIETKKAYMCSRVKFTDEGIDKSGCIFSMPKAHPYFASYGIKLTTSMISSLLSKGSVIVKKIKSKKKEGVIYDMVFHIEYPPITPQDSDPRPKFTNEFYNSPKKATKGINKFKGLKK